MIAFPKIRFFYFFLAVADIRPSCAFEKLALSGGNPPPDRSKKTKYILKKTKKLETYLFSEFWPERLIPQCPKTDWTLEMFQVPGPKKKQKEKKLF